MTFGVPRDMRLLLLDSQIPVTIPKGCDVMIRMDLVKADGTVELLIQTPLFSVPLDCFVARVVHAVEEEDGDGGAQSNDR